MELRVGALVQQQDLRCQIVDQYNHPIVVLRGENRDVTFSHSDMGVWMLETECEVSYIICDSAFKATKV